MENSSSNLHHKLQRLRYFNSRSKARRNKQRLIPLTREIQKDMMDFNGSQSSTTTLERSYCNTMSITTLVRDEVYNILQELSITDQFIRKGDIDQIIEKCLKEKVTVTQDEDTKAGHIILGDANEFEMAVEEITEDAYINKLIVKNIDVLEHRITILETRLSSMFQSIAKLRHIQAKRFKIKIHTIKEKRNALYNLDTQNEIEKPQDKPVDIGTKKGTAFNMYDDVFYTTREYTINLLNYKKSLETLKLNQKPEWNPNVKPVNDLPPQEKFKKRSMFLSTCDKNF